MSTNPRLKDHQDKAALAEAKIAVPRNEAPLQLVQLRPADPLRLWYGAPTTPVVRGAELQELTLLPTRHRVPHEALTGAASANRVNVISLAIKARRAVKVGGRSWMADPPSPEAQNSRAVMNKPTGPRAILLIVKSTRNLQSCASHPAMIGMVETKGRAHWCGRVRAAILSLLHTARRQTFPAAVRAHWGVEN